MGGQYLRVCLCIYACTCMHACAVEILLGCTLRLGVHQFGSQLPTMHRAGSCLMLHTTSIYSNTLLILLGAALEELGSS